jgi:hypothetical protein
LLPLLIVYLFDKFILTITARKSGQKSTLMGRGGQIMLPPHLTGPRLGICPLKGQRKFGHMAGFLDISGRGCAAGPA